MAGRQHRVISLTQLVDLGLSARAVQERVRAGRLRRVHRGVYAIGPLTVKGRWMAAVLACGPRAVLSHAAAARLWGLTTGPAEAHVTVPSRAGRRYQGIVVHRATTLHADDRTEHHDIPCTSVARTLLDIATKPGIERAVNEAEVLRIFDLGSVEAVIERNPRHAGARALETAVARYTEPVLTRAELEQRFYELLDRAGLPRPNVNAEIEGFQVDFSWPGHGLIIETDGWATHGTRRAFEEDRRRDRILKRAGWDVLRFTWREIVGSPDAVTVELRAGVWFAACTTT